MIPMKQFKVDDSIIVLDVDGICDGELWLTNGEEYRVSEVDRAGIYVVDDVSENFFIAHYEFDCIEKVVDSKCTLPSNKQRKQLINDARNDLYKYTKQLNEEHKYLIKFNVDSTLKTVESQVFDKKGINISGGFSKCLEGDVFNVFIGKLISLYKAGNKPIPDKYTNAVQPAETVEGHNCIIIDDSNAKY
jgi:hypothetical protein